MNIETNRLLLSEITLNDTEAIYQIYSHPKVIEYYSVSPVVGEEDSLNFISRIMADDSIICSIRLKENEDTIVGDCGLHNRNGEKSTIEIGGSLLPGYWGKGIIAEAFAALIHYAENQLHIKTIVAKTNRQNRQAIRALKKLGFTVSLMNDKVVILNKKSVA